jgi:hypothetical protein
MKTYRSARGPFQEAVHYEERDVERIVLEELARMQLLPSERGPIRVDRFIEKRFKVQIESFETKDGVLGFSQFGPNGVQAVYVAKALDEDKSVPGQRRLRSTVAHEAGHCLLHAHLFVLPGTKPLFADATDPNAPKVLCRDLGSDAGITRSYNGEWWEFQANMVMGHLLMPSPLTKQAAEPFLKPAGTLGAMLLPEQDLDDAARALAELFDVNPIVARIRIEKLYHVERSGQMML